MMTAIWDQRMESLERVAQWLNDTSPNFQLLATNRQPNEWRMVCLLMIHVLVLRAGGVQRAGPCQIGFRYNRRHLSCAPEPTELVTVLFPNNIFHPNVSPTGTMCVGHTRPGFSLEAIAHQVWGGLTMNGAFVNTTHGEVLNWQAAEYVRQHSSDFPFTRRGLFERET